MSLSEDLKKEFPELEQPESLWETLERDLNELLAQHSSCLLYTSPSPRD